ncbi:MAG: T9SS type A sorting domain-containing protein [Chitinophagaceae bacterium]
MPAEVVSMTVAQLYAAASKAIKDGDAKAGAYATAAGKLNEAFDACGMISPADKVVSKFSTMNAGMLGAFAAPTTNTLKVTAYPNPFNDRVFIKFASPVSGNAVVEFFDMTGRRLQSINKSNIVAGQENLVEYVVPVSFTRAIIYKVTIGEFSINGRMISPIR